MTEVGRINQLQQQSNTAWPPNSYGWWQQPVWQVPSNDGYANEVEVERREHDVVLTFWRNGPKNGKQRIAQVTVPLSVLKTMEGKK